MMESYTDEIRRLQHMTTTCDMAWELCGPAIDKEPRRPYCPICCREAETFYKYTDEKYKGEIVGCDKCMDSVDAWDDERGEDV